MSRALNIALVGATGTVGREILSVLAERAFPVAELRLLASEHSLGEVIEFGDEQLLVQKLEQDSFAGIDIALFCVGKELSLEFCPPAVEAGAICIDLSGAWWADEDVPLVAPEVNPQDLAGYTRRGIIAAPSAAVVALSAALKPLYGEAEILRVVLSTYQSVSGSGQQAIDELRDQVGELLNGRPAQSTVYPHQIAFNCLPQIGAFCADGATEEEQRLAEETRRLLGDRSLRISATAVRVPVFYGDSFSLNVETREKISATRAGELLVATPGVEVVDDPAAEIYPHPVDAAGQEAILVGRLREDASIEHGLSFWIVADSLRRGAATNAVQIAEYLAAHYL